MICFSYVKLLSMGTLILQTVIWNNSSLSIWIQELLGYLNLSPRDFYSFSYGWYFMKFPKIIIFSEIESILYYRLLHSYKVSTLHVFHNTDLGTYWYFPLYPHSCLHSSLNLLLLSPFFFFFSFPFISFFLCNRFWNHCYRT